MQSENYNEYSGLEELLHSEAMPNYNHFIVKTAKNAFGEPNQLIDFGAGIGTLSLIFREKYNINPLCVEIDKKNQEYHSQRKFQFFENLTSAPNNSDAIFSSNVLEHIEEEFLENVLDDLKKITIKIGFFTIATGPAKKILADGRNAHLIQKPTNWWLVKICARFEVEHLQKNPGGFLIIVKSKSLI